jgi:GcrA cell cycle regulator
MAPTEFHEALGALGIAQQRVAALFGVGPRSVRRWQYGERRIPSGVGIVLRLLATGAVTVEQVEQAAGPLSARKNGFPEPSAPLAEQVEQAAVSVPMVEAPAPANGGAEPGLPPAALDLEPLSEPSTDLAELTPEPSAPLPLEAEPTIPLADPVPTSTAEKVAELTSRICHWPIGDPQHSDFRFCGEATTIPPYCEEHRAVAYMVPPPRPVRRRHRHLYAPARIAWAG